MNCPQSSISRLLRSSQAAADGAAGAAGPQENPDGTVSGDYTVVDDDKKD